MCRVTATSVKCVALRVQSDATAGAVDDGDDDDLVVEVKYGRRCVGEWRRRIENEILKVVEGIRQDRCGRIAVAIALPVCERPQVAVVPQQDSHTRWTYVHVF